MTGQEAVLLRTLEILIEIETSDDSIEQDIEFAEMMAREWE